MKHLEHVRIHGLRKVFGQHLALAGVDLELRPGQITVLMGPNGAGKSTLLSILSTASRPTEGEVWYGEHGHRETELYLRHIIGLVAHAPLLYRDLSARENLRFFGKLYGLDGIEQRATSWLERTGLTAAADRPLREFSRGMTQRVALGRALLHDPLLLLLDEPFTALDRQGIALLRELTADAARRGTTVVIATHDIDAVDGLCDQQVILRHGRVAGLKRETSMSARDLVRYYHEALGEQAELGAVSSPQLAVARPDGEPELTDGDAAAR